MPVWAELAPTEQWDDPEAALGQLDLSRPPPSVRAWDYWEPCDPMGREQFCRQVEEWDRQAEEIRLGRRRHLGTWNQLTYDMASLERTQAGVKLHCKLGTYFHTRATSQILGPEIVDTFRIRPDLETDNAWPLLERRARLHQHVADPVADGRCRSAGIGVSTLTIVRAREQENDNYRLMLSPSSLELASQRGRHHVVPSDMFQPFTSDSPNDLRTQFSVRSTVLREFVEELFGVEELDTGNESVNPDAILQRPEARALTQMLDRGDAQLLYTGVAVNLLTLRPEICTVLIVHDPGWYDDHRTGLRLYNPHPTANRDAELLPDQRWIQLIGLTNRLDLDAAGQDVLDSATLVTPAWACLALGLHVAQHVLA